MVKNMSYLYGSHGFNSRGVRAAHIEEEEIMYSIFLFKKKSYHVLVLNIKLYM